MGKGDQRSRKGKITRGTYGKSRLRTRTILSWFSSIIMKKILYINQYAGSDELGMEFRPFYLDFHQS